MNVPSVVSRNDAATDQVGEGERGRACDACARSDLVRTLNCAICRYPSLFGYGRRVSNRYGFVGRIVALYASFASTGETLEWLDAQAQAFTDEQLAEVWAEVDCNGGPVLSPLSLLRPVET